MCNEILNLLPGSKQVPRTQHRLKNKFQSVSLRHHRMKPALFPEAVPYLLFKKLLFHVFFFLRLCRSSRCLFFRCLSLSDPVKQFKSDISCLSAYKREQNACSAPK